MKLFECNVTILFVPENFRTNNKKDRVVQNHRIASPDKLAGNERDRKGTGVSSRDLRLAKRLERQLQCADDGGVFAGKSAVRYVR